MRASGSESESETPRSDSDSEADSDVADAVNRRKGGKGKKKEYRPIEFREAWEQIKRVERDIEEKKKRFEKLEWVPVMGALEKEALENGFGDEELETLFKMISSVGNYVALKEKRDLIFLLIPRTQIKGAFVKRMCLWMVSGMHNNPVKMKSVVLQMLKYLHSVAEYSLVDGDCFGPYLYTVLFTLNSDSELLEWLFVLLKKITRKDNFQRFHVTVVLEKWKTAFVPSHKRALHNMLKKYKVLRPDYLPENVFAFHTKGRSSSRSKLVESLRKRLYEAKRRTHGLEVSQMENRMDETLTDGIQDEFDPQNLHNKNFFHELAPVFDNYSLKDVVTGRVPIGPKIVSWALLDMERLALFCTNDCLLEFFESYLSIALEYQFPRYAGSDGHKYEFLLDRAFHVSSARDCGLEAVDDWLPAFLVEWDMVLWRKQVLQLLPYLSPFEFNALSRLNYQKIEMDFLYTNAANSCEIWNAVVQLLSRWLKHLKVLEDLVKEGAVQYEEDCNFSRASSDELYALLTSSINKYIAINVYDKVCEPSIFRMMQAFVELSKKFNQKKIAVPIIPPLSLLYCIFLLDSTRLFDAFAEFLNNTSKWNSASSKEEFQRLKILRSKFKSFFRNELPFIDLFSQELGDRSDDELIQHLQKCLQSWTHESSQALNIFRSTSPANPGEMNISKMQQLAPNLAEYYNSIRKEDFVPMHASTPGWRKSRRIGQQ